MLQQSSCIYLSGFPKTPQTLISSPHLSYLCHLEVVEAHQLSQPVSLLTPVSLTVTLTLP